jgi:hypothetical protein
MRILRKAACLAVLVAIVPIGTTLLGSNPPQSFTIAIGTVGNTFKLGAKIPVQVVLTNTSDHDINAAVGKGDAAEDAGYVLEVWDAKGDHSPETKLKSVGKEVSSAVGVTLSPGQSVKNRMIVNEFYYLTSPGKYQIQVSLTDPDTKVVVRSNKITVTVTSEPAEQPCRVADGRRCEDLMK